MSVCIRDVVARMQVVDGDSLLTPQMLARIVSAVTQSLAACEQDERSRKRDTKVGTACSGGCESEDAA